MRRDCRLVMHDQYCNIEGFGPGLARGEGAPRKWLYEGRCTYPVGARRGLNGSTDCTQPIKNRLEQLQYMALK